MKLRLRSDHATYDHLEFVELLAVERDVLRGPEEAADVGQLGGDVALDGLPGEAVDGEDEVGEGGQRHHELGHLQQERLRPRVAPKVDIPM